MAKAPKKKLATKKQSSSSKSVSKELSSTFLHRLQEGALIIFGAIALFFILSLATHNTGDPSWTFTGSHEKVVNSGGLVGAWLSDLLLYLFGHLAYLIPLIIGYIGWLMYQDRDAETLDYFHIATRFVGLILIFTFGCGLAWFRLRGMEAGGILGNVVGSGLVSTFGASGATLMMLSLFLTGITLLTGLSWLWLMDTTGYYTLELIEWLKSKTTKLEDFSEGRKAKKVREVALKQEKKDAVQRPERKIEPKISTFEVAERVEVEKQTTLFRQDSDAVLPPLDLLDDAPPKIGGYSKETLEAMSRQVELKLKDFGVTVVVTGVLPGPVITRFEMEPAAGTKASKITALTKDLARSLSVTSVRVVEVIPGKSVIGLEIPNEKRELIALSEILSSRQYDSSSSALTLCLGKDISGRPEVADLVKMPHLLVAGTTGSGKSVALNAMILSLLYKATSKEVRLIMIDPKMLELSVYEGIPHLLAPVVTDMKEAANALRWSVAEMERRYKLMSHVGVRNLAGYNKKIEDAIKKNLPFPDPFADPTPEGESPVLLDTMPNIVVIVDELADMMMTTGKKVEQLIARLAQKARAAGIHLILATQRPSVDVITGLIKANIPTRVAFQVSSRVDSRTILDQMGAENLLGHGDMLYLAPGTGLPNRVHGAFVSDEEVHEVVNYLKAHGEPEYIDEILEGPVDGGGDMGGGDYEGAEEVDALYDEAVAIVTESRKASISYLQRRLKVGYNRSARMIEQMERDGVIAENAGGGREVIAPPPPPSPE